MKTFEIYITNKEELVDKYDKNTVSQDLINHLVESVSAIDLKEQIKIIINNNLKSNQKCVPIIIVGLKKEYNKNVLNYNHNSKIQFIYFVLGVLIIFVSTLIKGTVLREVALIGGWVLIWSMIEIEIFTDMKIKRKRKVLKKIIESDIQEIKKIMKE